MKIVLPGAVIGLLGGGENSRMLALAAYRMGYRVHVFSQPGDTAVTPLADISIQAPYDDLDRLREFAAAVEVVTVAESGVPMIALRAVAGASVVRPSPKVFDAIEDSDGGGIGAKRSTTAPLVDFSIIGARGTAGEFVFYPPIAIDRVDGAVDIARSPAPLNAKLVRRAVGLTRDTLEDLDLIGLTAVEFTLTQDGELVLHDVTPHAHPSGNLTVDSCVTSQFEQQLRAVCGLPLGSTEMLRPAAMAVLPDAASPWASAYAFPQVKLHPYGARGGFLTATAKSATQAKQIVLAARASLTSSADV